jgi:hypothetical protein
MEEIVARATELECEDRFKSAEQVKIALKALQEKSTKTVTDSETSTDSKSC